MGSALMVKGCSFATCRVHCGKAGVSDGINSTNSRYITIRFYYFLPNRFKIEYKNTLLNFSNTTMAVFV